MGEKIWGKKQKWQKVWKDCEKMAKIGKKWDGIFGILVMILCLLDEKVVDFGNFWWKTWKSWSILGQKVEKLMNFG